jgi:hypothetical protein
MNLAAGQTLVRFRAMLGSICYLKARVAVQELLFS